MSDTKWPPTPMISEPNLSIRYLDETDGIWREREATAAERLEHKYRHHRVKRAHSLN